MTRGLFHVAGDHNAIITSLSQALAVLRRGELYLTVTVPSFWRPDHIGIMGRFYTMNLEIAKRGVRIRRVFILTKDDEKGQYFKAIITRAKGPSSSIQQERAAFGSYCNL